MQALFTTGFTRRHRCGTACVLRVSPPPSPPPSFSPSLLPSSVHHRLYLAANGFIGQTPPGGNAVRSPAAEPRSVPHPAAQLSAGGLGGGGAAAPWGTLTAAGLGGGATGGEEEQERRGGETCPRFPPCTGTLSLPSGLHNGAGCGHSRGS